MTLFTGQMFFPVDGTNVLCPPSSKFDQWKMTKGVKRSVEIRQVNHPPKASLNTPDIPSVHCYGRVTGPEIA